MRCTPRFVRLLSLLRVIESCAQERQDSDMRVNLITQPSNRSEAVTGTIPLSLTIKPACGLPGDYDCQTDSKTLMRLLRLKSDLPAYALEQFEAGLRNRVGAKLLGVDLNDSVLMDIGY